LEWLAEIPSLIRRAVADGSQRLIVGQKLFNAMFEDEFQLEMLKTAHLATGENRSDLLVYGNRLFDPSREFDGAQGVAYGGPDLSDRNLRTMSAFRQIANKNDYSLLPWSATGNINSGQMALNYEQLGASSFQLHTYFQLPADQYHMRIGSRTQRALHELYFHPTRGYVLRKLVAGH